MEKHDLVHEFPEHKEKIHFLKSNDAHFKSVFEKYHEVNNEIHRIETGAENTSDEALNVLRKERLKLKDNLYGMLN